MSGLIGRKLGMTQMETDNGDIVACTVIQAGPCVVLGQRKKEKDGYSAIRLGFGEVRTKRLSLPLLGELKKALGERDSYPVERIAEFQVPEPEAFPVGAELKVDLFEKGERVSVTGISKGKGFQSVIRRWGFSGGPRSHGSKFHRRPGSIGQHTDPGRIWKGKKMAGHTGMKRVTQRGLEVLMVIPEKNLVVIKGTVPGPSGSLVFLKKMRAGVKKT